MNVSDRWNRALDPGTRANLLFNAAIRLIALLGLAGLWLTAGPDSGAQSLLAGVSVGVLLSGLNLALGRSERFMRVWRERTALRGIVAVGLASGFVVAADRALGVTVVAVAVVMVVSLLYHAVWWMREDF